MMSLALAIMVLLALGHFVYEGIIAPSLRMDLRYKFFALRDELRRLKEAHPAELSDKHYRALEDSINGFIQMLPRFDVGTVIRVNQEIESNPALKREIDERIAFLESCAVPEAKEIRRRSRRLALSALRVNAGGLYLYCFWVILLVKAYDSTDRYLRRVMALSKGNVDQLIPAFNESMA